MARHQLHKVGTFESVLLGIFTSALTSVLGVEGMATVLIDRLLHHCNIVNIRGNSYRMRAHQGLQRIRADEDGIRAGTT